MKNIEIYLSRIRGPYARFCERAEAVTPQPSRYAQLNEGA